MKWISLGYQQINSDQGNQQINADQDKLTLQWKVSFNKLFELC